MCVNVVVVGFRKKKKSVKKLNETKKTFLKSKNVRRRGDDEGRAIGAEIEGNRGANKIR